MERQRLCTGSVSWFALVRQRGDVSASRPIENLDKEG